MTIVIIVTGKTVCSFKTICQNSDTDQLRIPFIKTSQNFTLFSKNMNKSRGQRVSFQVIVAFYIGMILILLQYWYCYSITQYLKEAWLVLILARYTILELCIVNKPDYKSWSLHTIHAVTNMKSLLTIKLFLTWSIFFFQNEKEQILTTNVWLNLVSTI